MPVARPASKATSSPDAKLAPGLRLQRALVSIATQAARDLERMRSGHHVDDSIHALRVRMKKLHALLNLIRSGISKTAHKEVKNHMRTLKQAFAVGRDQKVIHALLHEFCGKEMSVPRPSVIVDGSSTAASSLFAPQKLRKLKAAARALVAQLRELKLHRLNWKTIAAAYRDNYASARRKFKRCQSKPAARPLHKWRSPVKDHYYQTLCLMRDPIRSRLAHKLGSLLGKYHDLVLLRDHLHSVSPQTRMPMIKREMRNLLRRAFRKAGKLFDLSPKKIEHQVLAVIASK